MAVTIFTGPSLPPQAAARLFPQARVLPPVSRGALYQARDDGAAYILMIDGTFTQTLAVSPREVVDVLADGAVVLGASSMGAVRAAECWPVGMQGVGAIYRMYRAGILSSDDAVAVSTDPDRDFAPVSVALVNVYAATRRAVGRGLLTRSQARAVEDAATGIFFPQRSWQAILKHAGVVDDAVAAFVERVDIKRVDAVRGVSELRRASAAGGGRESPVRTVRPGYRYRGHDPMLGLTPAEVPAPLVRWLFGSGRYQRYIWALVIGEPEFQTVREEKDRAEALRERLAAVLARCLSEPVAFGERLIGELAYLEELDSELMRWHAVERLADDARRHGQAVPAHARKLAREEVAIAHGFDSWHSLSSDIVAERLYGAIPMEWVVGSCDRIAAARLGHRHSTSSRAGAPGKPRSAT